MPAEFTADSLPYVIARWSMLLPTVLVIGAVVFRLYVLKSAERMSETELDGFIVRASLRTSSLGFAAVLLAMGGLTARLIAQGMTLSDPGNLPSMRLLRALITDSTWGTGWLMQAIGLLVMLLAFLPATRRRSASWSLAGIAVVPLVLGAATSGHAASARLVPIALVADALHGAAAGAWMGVVMILALVGAPAAVKDGPEGGEAFATVLQAFSPFAIRCAVIVVVTGMVGALLHIGSIAALTTTKYGQTLLLKVALVAGIALLGFVNWRVMGPRLARSYRAKPIWVTIALEALLAVGVLFVTAVLMATDPVLSAASV